MDAVLTRLEGYLRRVVWVYVERPAAFYSCVAGGAAVLGYLAFVRRRRARPQPKALADASPAEMLQAIGATVKRAAASGFLMPLATRDARVLEERGVPFVVTALDTAATAKKRAASPPTPARGASAGGGGQPKDAFAVLEPESVVAPLSPSYNLVLNKFPVVDQHVLVVTSQFVPQAGPMTEEDLGALWQLVAPMRGLGFYNSGEPSGASQPRRHMQFIPPEPLWARYPQPVRARLGDAGYGAADAAVPVDAAVAAAREAGGYRQPPGQPFTLPAFSGFPHAACVLGGDLADGLIAPHAPLAAARLHEWYSRLLEVAAAAQQHAASGGGTPLRGDAPSTPTAAPAAHNVLLTRRWMLVVPRAQAEWGGLSVNALAYAGLLLTKDAAQAQALEAAGPLQVLRACATGLVADA